MLNRDQMEIRIKEMVQLNYKKLITSKKASHELMDKFEYKNIHQIPKITKIVLNMGIGDAKTNSKSLESAVEELAAISGQKPIITKSKSDISEYKGFL